MPKRGRPKLEFDLKQIKLMGQFRATHETMAEWFECSVQTIHRELERNPEFSQAYKKGFANTKMKIAEAQVNYALKGNPTLLIWLGKQYLGQHEPLINSTPDNDVDFTELTKAIRDHYGTE